MPERRLRQFGFTVLLISLLWHGAGPVAAQRSRTRKTATGSPAQAFTIAASQSRITVTLTQQGMIKRMYPIHSVAVRAFSGRIELPPNDESRASVEVSAEAKSLTNIDEKMSDFERNGFQQIRHENVLESSRYPTISFRSVSVTNIQSTDKGRKFTLNGDLTLRGVTRRVALPVSVVITDKQLRAIGEAKFKQTGFRIESYAGRLVESKSASALVLPS